MTDLPLLSSIGMLTVKPTVVKKTADQGSGDAEAAEHGDLLRQHQAEGVHGGAKREGMVHIELDLCHVGEPP